MIDYYKTLSVDKNATTTDIKKAYRIKALEWHPDKNKSINAKEKFIEVHEAYKILSDVTLRRRYDELLQNHSDPQPNGTSSSPANEQFNDRSRKARQQATEYAEDFDLFSKKVLMRGGLIFLLAIFDFLLGSPSRNSIGLIFIVIGLFVIFMPIDGYEEKPAGAYWIGGIVILLGAILFIRRLRAFVNELEDE